MRVKITDQVVQAVRDTVDILDIAADLTTLKQNGKRHVGLCPFHKEKSPSFGVDADKGLYYCFGCGAGGDAIKLYMQSSGDDFPAAIEALARRYGIPLPTVAPGERGGPSEPRVDIAKALEAAADFFTHQLSRNAEARRYLDQRKIPESLRQRYQLGYAPAGWDDLLVALARRIPLDMLIAAGLVGRSQKTGKPYDRFRHRLMFPIHNASGRLVGFGGRTLGDDKAKYINTAETEQFHKGRLLYGLHQAKRPLRDSGRAILVEGYFDVLGAAACGLDGSVAGMGTALTPEQAKLLKRYVDEVILAYDGDEAGARAASRALPLLLAEGLVVRRARFPVGHDPDSLRLEQGAETVRELIDGSIDGVWLEIEQLLPPVGDRSPAAQARAAPAIVELLRPLRDAIVRRGYAKRAAEHLGVPEDLLLRRLGPQLYNPVAVDNRQARSLRDEGEERALQLLFSPSGALPLPEELPGDEIFLDPICRKIYTTFCELYGRDGRTPPRDAIIARLAADDDDASNLLARLILDESTSEEHSLRGALAEVEGRWLKRRESELVREIRQAQERGDGARLEALLVDKQALSRRKHRL